MKLQVFLIRFLCYIFLIVPAHSVAQSCSCSELLWELIDKTQSNYAGYVHKIKGNADSSAYFQLKKKLSKEASSTSFRDCYNLMTQYVDYFKDGHLFVIELPRNTPQQSDSLKQYIKSISVNDEWRQKVKEKKPQDPIEGIWKDKDQQLAIIKSSGNKFIAVTLQNSNVKWTPGMVKMEIERIKPGEYFVTLYRNDFAPIRFSNVHIYKNCVLPFGVYRFAKAYPVQPESSYIDSANPEMPFFKQLDAKNILLTVPTALINRNVLDSVLRRHEKEIKSTENLIIDVRGNPGGNSIWRNLGAIANTKEYAPEKKPGVEDFLLLASTDNADYIYDIGSYFRQVKDSAGIAYYDKLANKIRENIGSIIGFSFYDPRLDTVRRTIYEFPKRVAILTDKGTASAGEAFVLSMRENSKKVVVYGSNTYGMIDYMNINTKKLSCNGNNTYYYGYPTFFSPSTKTEPINPTGIKPDFYIPNGITDWIQWVRNDLSK